MSHGPQEEKNLQRFRNMTFLIIALAVLGVFAAILGLVSQRRGGETAVVRPATASCATCSGGDPRCEQECMMEAATKEIEYYDDEELDDYRGRPSDSYTDEEAERFADVMYTMRPDEVRGWGRSLVLRGVSLPDQLKDEFVMLASGQ